MQDLQASGELPIRFRMHYHVPHQISLDGLLAMGLQPGFGDDMLRYGGVKIFVDGVGHDGYGNRVFDVKWDAARNSPSSSAAPTPAASNSGCTSAPSRPSGMICDGVEEALRRNPGPHRHRIEHAADYLIEDADIARVQALGMRAITTPAFIRAQGDVLALPGSQRWPRTFRLRTLAERGFEIIGCSDSTGSIPDGIPPLYNIACAVTRRTLSGGTYVPEEALDIDDALRLFTIWPARGAFEEQDKGTHHPRQAGRLRRPLRRPPRRRRRRSRRPVRPARRSHHPRRQRRLAAWRVTSDQ